MSDGILAGVGRHPATDSGVFDHRRDHNQKQRPPGENGQRHQSRQPNPVKEQPAAAIRRDAGENDGPGLAPPGFLRPERAQWRSFNAPLA